MVIVQGAHRIGGTGSGAYPAFYPMGTGGPNRGDKAAGGEAGHSPTSTEGKNTWIYTPPLPYVFMVK
jgi:hypothetical protein